MRIRNIRGFSLVELMVVVTLIAIVSTLAIPSYRGFVARARQKEGMNHLARYFQAAQSAQAQYGFYPGNLVLTGFMAEGMLGYRVHVGENANSGTVATIFNDATCIDTMALCDCGGACMSYKTWTDTAADQGIAMGRFGPVDGNGGVGGCIPAVTNDTTFIARAGGVINTSSVADILQINERKVYTACQDGLR